MSWSIIQRKRKEMRFFENSFFPAGDSQTEKRVFWKVYAWLALSVKVATLSFTKSVKFGFGELSISRICSESRDLGPENGFRACSFKNKRKKSDVHTSWDQKAN